MQKIRTRKQLNYLACQINIRLFLNFFEHGIIVRICTIQNRKLEEVNNKPITTEPLKQKTLKHKLIS